MLSGACVARRNSRHKKIFMVINFLTKIQNSSTAKKETVRTDFSKMNLAVAEILCKEGYLERAETKGRLPKRIIEVRLKKDKFFKIKHISKPSKIIYTGYKNIQPSKRGGIIIVSTSKGLKEAREARRERIGGVMLFEIF